MKKLVLLLGFIFYVTFAANAQLVYKNGALQINVPDNYRMDVPNVNFPGINHFFKGHYQIFVGMTGGQFFIEAAGLTSGSMGPIRVGTVSMWGFTANGRDYHNLRVKNLYSSSDARTKTNIRPMSSAMGTILRLNPVTYQFVNRSYDQSARSVVGADGTETGFIAQEVARILPNAVTIDEEDNYLVNYISIIPVLTKAIQELNTRVEVLEKENAALKNR